MAAMKDTILPSRKKSKHKKRKHGKSTGEPGSGSDDSYNGIEKVHQDDDYSKFQNLLLPLISNCSQYVLSKQK